jgi:DNA polymerase III psi subunit
LSSKALYQTLYQSEHLFRVPTETLTDWGAEPMAVVAPVEIPPAPRVRPVSLPELPMVVEEIVVQVVSMPEPVEPEPIQSIPDTKPPVRSQETPKPALLKHKVLLLADEDLSPSDLLFLERILKAVNLDIDGVDLLNVYGVSEVDFAAVLRHKYINHFITFGVPFQRINLDIMMDRYHPIRFDGITFLMADSLPVIEANPTLKRLLWNSLKRVFEL